MNRTQNIRLFNGSDVQTENVVMRITVRPDRLAKHAKQLSRVTEFLICTEQLLWILFLAYRFPSTTVFNLQYALFYLFNAKISTKCSVRLLSTMLTSERLVANDVKTSV